MKTRRLLLIGLTGLVLLILAVPVLAQPLAAPSADVYDLTWNTWDGSGGTLLSGDGVYSLGATAGQPEAGLLTNGYTLSGGFWFGAAPGYTIALPVISK